MKYTPIILALSLLFTACSQRDTKYNQQIPGTWIGEAGVGMKNTMTISPDGSFSIIAPQTEHTTNFLAGTWQIRNGYYIMTLTNVVAAGNHPSVGQVEHYRIIHADDHQFVYYDEESRMTNSLKR